MWGLFFSTQPFTAWSRLFYMEPKVLLRLFLLSLTLCCLNMTCPRDCDGCYMASLSVSAKSSASVFQEVINLENNKVVWQDAHPGDTLWISIPLDPSRPKSSFIFYYDSKAPDTLVLAHQFKEAYDEDCDDYYFDKAAASLEKNTFGEDLIFNNEDECVQVDIFFP